MANDASDKIDPNGQYRVKVSRMLPIGRSGTSFLRPTTDNRVKGAFLTALLTGEHKDAVESYEEV